MKHPVFSRVIALMLFCAFMLQAIPAVSLPALATEGTAMLDRLTLDGGYTLAFDANTLTYEVKLPAGHPRIPQISATADGAVTVTQAAMPVSQNQATGYVKVASKEYSITFVKDPSLGYHLQYGDYYAFVPETEAEIKGFVSSAPDTISVSSAGVLHALALSDSPVTISAIAQDDSVAATMTVDKVVKAPLNLFLITGQSNAYGSYDIPSGMDEASFTAAQMVQTLKPAPGTVLCTDVSNKGVILQDMYDLSQGRSGFSPALGKTWYDLTGEKTLMLQTAVGGAPIEAWMKPEGGVRNTYNYTESNFYETTKNAYTHTMQKLQAENSGYELRHTYAYWLQGETGMGNSYNPNKNGAGIGGWDMGSTANILSSQQYYDIFMKNMEYFTGEFGCEFVGILLVRALAGAASAESLELQLLTDLTPTRAAQYALNNRNSKQISIVSRVCDIARMESYSDTSVPGWGYMGCNNLHYNQIGHNANGVEAAKNTYDIMFGRKSAYDLEIIAPNGRDRIEDGQQIVLRAGQSYQTAAMVLPMSAQTKKISYQVADSTVCSVDAFGKITASAEGAGKSTTVTYTCAESGLRKSITVRVESDSASGTLNSSISWTYQSGVLTITGSGATPTYTAATRPFADIADRVTKIIVGEGITDLNGYVLYQMNKAQSIQLPSTLKKIQVRALANNTALKALEIPAGVTVLGAYCFEKSGIQELSFLGAAPTTISGSKPCNGNTYTLHIPCSDTSWTAAKQTALGGTQTVEQIHDYQDGICSLCGKAQTSSVPCGADITWSFAQGVLTLTGTGSTYNYELAGVSADGYVFKDIKDQVKEIVVGEGITILGKHIFYKMPVEKVTLPKSLTHIDTRALGGGGKLTEVVIYSKLANLGYNCLVGSGATDIYILGGVPKNISNTPLGGLTYNLHIPCNDTSWTADMLAKLGGTRTVVTEHVGGCPECGDPDAVGGSCGANVTWKLADGVLTLSGSGDTDEFVRTAATDTVNYPWAEHIDAITAIVVEEGITNLDNYCFYNLSKVTSVTLPQSLKRVETRVFSGCTALKELTIPGTLDWAGYEAFAGSGITDLHFKADPPKGCSGTAPCKNMTYNLHIPCNNTAWTGAKIAALGGTATQVLVHNYVGGVCTQCNSQPGGQLGGSCGENVNWTLKDGILTLSGSGDTAEYVRNSDTDTVNYPWADYINAITAIVVEEGITNLDNYVFYNLKNVTSVTLPNSLERLETRIFKGCTSLQALTVPSTLKYLGLEAFAGSGIKDLYFKANAPEKFSGTKPCANQSMNVHVSCGNASWTADKLSAMGTALSLVLTHKWSGDQCTDCGAAKDMPVASVTLDRASVSLSLAQTVTITAKVMPENATNKTLTWTSSDESVAVVSGGVVTPKGAGTATITATTTDGSGKTASCVVNVSDKLEGSCGQSVSWRIQNGVLTISGTGATTEYVRQSGANSVNTPWWNVRDLVTSIVVEEGVTVLDNYLFYGLSNAASVRLPKSLTRIETRVFTKCDALTELTVPAAKVYLGYEAFAGSGITDLSFTAGAHGGCSATAPCKDMTYNLHLNCTAQNWTSAQLDAMGGKLSLVIDHSWSNGKCSACGVKENTPITSITLDKTELSVYCMGTYTVKATITPADATDQVLQWTSSDEAVATVSAVGTVTGVAPGTAVITASAKDGSGVTATCTVTVKDGLGGSCGDHANWTFVDGVLTITGWGSTTKFVRNAQKDTIYYPWADFKDEITKVVVGEGITVLNNYAFYNCKNIRSVRLPGTLKEIAYGAFYGTSSLGSITIPANVTKLGSQAFKGSGLRSVTFLGLSPSSYGKNLFDGVVATVYYLCNDSARSFGDGLTWEKTHTFAEEDGVRKCSKCHELDGTAVTGITLDQTKLLLMSGQSIQLIATVEPANAAYPQVVWSSSEEAVASVSEDGTVTALEAGSAQIIAKAKDGGDVQAVCSVTVRQGVGGQIGDLYWIYHYGKLTITGQGPMPQTNIAPWALYAEEIVELTVEPGVTAIGEKAFAGLEQLAIVHLPETLTQIDAGAFENTRMLKEIEIPASVTALGSRAFADCGLTQIRFLGYLPDAAGDVFTGVTATATILCDDNPKAMGGDITWEQGHDYQPSGEKYVCINCGSETDSISEPAGDQNAAGLGWLWWLLAVAAVAAGAVAVILGRKKQKER